MRYELDLNLLCKLYQFWGPDRNLPAEPPQRGAGPPRDYVPYPGTGTRNNITTK